MEGVGCVEGKGGRIILNLLIFCPHFPSTLFPISLGFKHSLVFFDIALPMSSGLIGTFSSYRSGWRVRSLVEDPLGVCITY